MPPGTVERGTTVPPEKKFGPNNVDLQKDTLAKAIQDFDVVVLQGHTGSGKTVSGPPAFLEGLQRAHPGKNVRMLVGEPRQFLAKGSAQIVAKRQNKEFGKEYVGFYHGDESNFIDKKTQIVYTVNGSIRNSLQRDITLAEYDAVFLDEIHLQEIDQYAIRIGLRQCQIEREKKHMPPLKIVIASADATQRDGDYHGNAKLIEVAGTKPQHVEQIFSDKAVSLQDAPKEIARKAAQIVKDKKNYGDILGFLPGRAEIIEAKAEFDRIMQEEGLGDEYKSALLTGGGGDENKALQAKLTAGNDDRSRPPIVVFGTDVAETGANFPWLTKVIDAGFSRIDVFDDATGISRLETRPVAYAGYKQRLGRLGRADVEGEFYALYPKEELEDETKHPKSQPPAIIKSDLTQLVLSLKHMGLTDVYNLEYPDPPGKEKIDNAVKTLSMLGALHPDGRLTEDVGEKLSEFPMDPHHARMFIEAKKYGCVEAIGVLYGFLNSQRSVFDVKRGEQVRTKYKEFVDPTSDFLTFLNVWNAYLAAGKDAKAWAEKKGLNLSVLRDVATAKRDLVGEGGLKNTDLEWKHKPIDVSFQKDAISEAIIAGFADKLLQRGENMKFALVDGAKKDVQIDSSRSAITSSEYLLSGGFRMGRGSISTTLNHHVSQKTFEQLVAKISGIKAQLQTQQVRELKKMPEHTVGETPEVDTQGTADALKQTQPLEQTEHHTDHTETSSDSHDHHAKLEQVKADIHAIESHVAHNASHHEDSHQGGSHSTHEKTSGWAAFKEVMQEIGHLLATPWRKLWQLFKGSGGKHGGGGHH